MLAVENIGKWNFDSPKFSLPVFYKSVNLISHDPVDLTALFILNMTVGNILKYFRPVSHCSP